MRYIILISMLILSGCTYDHESLELYARVPVFNSCMNEVIKFKKEQEQHLSFDEKRSLKIEIKDFDYYEQSHPEVIAYASIYGSNIDEEVNLYVNAITDRCFFNYEIAINNTEDGLIYLISELQELRNSGIKMANVSFGEKIVITYRKREEQR